MNTPTHPQLVAALVKPGQAIIDSLTPLKAHLWHMASCIPGEAGELFDAIKKLVLYGKILDRENVVEELGDLEFYLEGLRAALNITRQETLDHNIAKLSKRYAGMTYSNEAAVGREDKEQERMNERIKLEDAIVNLRSNSWFTNAHADRLRGIKDLCIDKLKGIKNEESFERMIAKSRWVRNPEHEKAPGHFPGLEAHARPLRVSHRRRK